MSSIRALRIEDRPGFVILTTAFLDCLTYRNEEKSCLLPKLQEVEFSNCEQLDDEKLVEMIRSRWELGVGQRDDQMERLRIVNLRLCQSITTRSRTELRALRDEGLLVAVEGWAGPAEVSCS